MSALTLNLKSLVALTDEQFYQLCADNCELKLERTATGELVIMPPTGGETGKRNADLNFQLFAWNRQTQLGVVFDSSTGFKLPNGANRSPDTAWIPNAKRQALSSQQRQRFLPLCPDFLIELLSPTDNWQESQTKMQEYQDNGNLLGWLIDPATRRVAIYRRGQPAEVLSMPSTLSGEALLPGFVLDLQTIWE